MNRSQVVIDSGVAILRVLNTTARPTAIALWDQLLRDGTRLYAPRLWSYEVTSVVHRYLFDRLLTPGEANDVLRVILGFGVDLVAEDEGLCIEAFRWATRLNQRPAYDAFYLAVAQSLDAELWTADRRLCHNARQAGADWVHCMDEIVQNSNQ